VACPAAESVTGSRRRLPGASTRAGINDHRALAASVWVPRWQLGSDALGDSDQACLGDVLLRDWLDGLDAVHDGLLDDLSLFVVVILVVILVIVIVVNTESSGFSVVLTCSGPGGFVDRRRARWRGVAVSVAHAGGLAALRAGIEYFVLGDALHF